jgi:putative IMPACT (imprinted ancient) family translation regulator
LPSRSSTAASSHGPHRRTPHAAQAFVGRSPTRRHPQLLGLADRRDYRSSDDGEPAGTAGRPILAAIDGQGFDRVMVVVTRWFGGIKLGAGGLVRAYGGAAAECLRTAPRVPLVGMRTLVLAGFDDLGSVHAALAA